MTLKLQEVAFDEDFDAISLLQWDAFTQPRNDFFQVYNSLQQPKEQVIQVAKERNLKSCHEDPASHWLKVVDSDTGGIIAAACWQIHKEAPPLPHKPFVADWHPEGSDERKFASMFFDYHEKRAVQRMNRPHIELDQIVTHPAHRRRGAGGLLLQWGVDKADELGLEACIHSVLSARPVYERYGFVVTDIIDDDMSVPNPSERWQELQQLELKAFYMWRPKGGKFVEGETVIPWHSST